MSLSNFQISDIRNQTLSSFGKSGELDNWPSTNSHGSKSWLSRLENFLESRLETLANGDQEHELLAYHECFAKFIEFFKNYRPLLSRIYDAYQKFIEYSQVSLRRVTELELEMFALEERTQAEVRKSAVDAVEKLRGMEHALVAAQAQENKAISALQKAEKELEEAKAAVEQEKQERNKMEETSKAYCSGYKWLIKNVLKTEEPNDLDALESVTLIQKLERALADAQTSRWQMEYLTSTSEVTQAKSLLEEERKLFGIETERIQTELDNLRHYEADVSRKARQAEARNEALQEQVATMQNQLDNMFLVHIGDGEDVPPLLRTKRAILNRQTSKEEALELTSLIYREATERYNSGRYPHLEEIIASVVTDFYKQHTVAEWSRNFLDALEEHRMLPDCAIIGGVWSEGLGQHALLARCSFFPDLADKLTALAFKLSQLSTAAPADTDQDPSSYDEVAVEDILAELSWVFNLKSEDFLENLREFLIRDEVRAQRVSIPRLRRGAPLGFEEEFIEVLQAQLLEEVKEYVSDLRALMVAAAAKRKSKQAGHQIGVAELRDVLRKLEPNKTDEDVAVAVWRGFALPSFEDAFCMVTGETVDAPNEPWTRATSTVSDPGSVGLEPIERILFRLSAANLLHKTVAEPLPMPPPPIPAALGQSGGSEGEEPRPIVESVNLEAAHFEAVRVGLADLSSAPAPRWARKADPGAAKPFLNTLVQAYRGRQK